MRPTPNDGRRRNHFAIADQPCWLWWQPSRWTRLEIPPRKDSPRTPNFWHPSGGTTWRSQTTRLIAMKTNVLMSRLSRTHGPTDLSMTWNELFWLADPDRCHALIGQYRSCLFLVKSVIGANCADSQINYCAETMRCHGNELIYSLKIYWSAKNLCNVT